jgi:PadR family transcriptional regulator PadR
MILFLLFDEPSYGYEISRQIRQRTEEKYVMKETTLYSAFNRLEANGFLESFYGTETSGKQRTYYRITQSGRDYYARKKAEWGLTKEVVEKFIR